MYRLFAAILLLVGLVPTSLHGSPAPTYEAMDARTAGQRVSMRGTSATISGHIGSGCDAWVSILKPDNNQVTGASACVEGGGYMEVVTLPVTGQYTVVVDPLTMALGGVTLTLYDVPPNMSGTITPGTPLPVSFSIPGQNASYMFSGTQGQRISFTATAGISGHSGFGCDVWVAILKPDTYQLASLCIEGGGFLDSTLLPVTGTYTLAVDPQTTATGSTTLTLYDVSSDVSGTLTINGGALGITIPNPGLQATLTFDGTQGQQLTVRITGNTIGLSAVTLFRPDNVQMTTLSSAAASFNLATQTLPTTGTYQVVVNPSGNRTGNINVAVTSP